MYVFLTHAKMEERVNVKFLFILVTSMHPRTTHASVLLDLYRQIVETVSKRKLGILNMISMS